MLRTARRAAGLTVALVLSTAGARAQTSPSYRVPARPPGYAPSYPPGYPPPGYPASPAPGYPGYPPPGYPGYPSPGYAPPPGQGYPPTGYPPGYTPPPGYAPWTAQYHYAPPPAPAARRSDPSDRYHDTFYLRMTIGPGFVSAKQRFEPSPNALVPLRFPFDNPPQPMPSALLVSGFTTSFDIMLGGTPIPGFVVGGTFIFNAAPEPNVTLGDTTVPSNESFVFWMPAMFIDVFPNPAQGFHFGAIGGIAAVSWERSGTGNDASGVGGGAFVGYDAWVGNQWALGGLVRAIAGTATDTDSNGRAKFTTGSIAVMGTVLYQ